MEQKCIPLSMYKGCREVLVGSHCNLHIWTSMDLRNTLLMSFKSIFTHKRNKPNLFLVKIWLRAAAFLARVVNRTQLLFEFGCIKLELWYAQLVNLVCLFKYDLGRNVQALTFYFYNYIQLVLVQNISSKIFFLFGSSVMCIFFKRLIMFRTSDTPSLLDW